MGDSSEISGLRQEKESDFVLQKYPEIASLRHPNLDSNPKFLLLKRQLEKYLIEKDQKSRFSLHGKSEKWTEVLYTALSNALTELTFIEDHSHQLVYLERIHTWFICKAKIKTDLPETKRTTETFTGRPKTSTSTQDNSIDARRERMMIRKMDAVPSIESRAQSPSKSPHLPKVSTRSQSYMVTAGLDSSHSIDKPFVRVMRLQQRERAEFRGMQTHEKLLKQWSHAAARREEAWLAKAEINSMRPRVMTTLGGKRRETDVSNTSFSRMNLSTNVDSAKGVDYIDLRQEQDSLMSPGADESGTEEHVSFIAQSKADRLRQTSRHLVQSSSGTRIHRPDRCTLSCYTPPPVITDTSQILENALKRDVSEGGKPSERRMEEMSGIRRKLVSRQVTCSYRDLSSGLFRPDELPQVSPLFLPKGDEYFTSNPFSPLGKKKKKKGKKGKKAKKKKAK